MVKNMAKSNKKRNRIIEEVLQSLDGVPSKPEIDNYYHDKIYSILKERHKEEIVKASLIKYYKAQELKPYQAELIKMQAHLERTGKKMIILFDGRDASGKGGTIRRITRYMNEKHYRVVALGKPSHVQQTELHIKRYIEQFPRAGEIVLFDRSW